MTRFDDIYNEYVLASTVEQRSSLLKRLKHQRAIPPDSERLIAQDRLVLVLLYMAGNKRDKETAHRIYESIKQSSDGKAKWYIQRVNINVPYSIWILPNMTNAEFLRMYVMPTLRVQQRKISKKLGALMMINRLKNKSNHTKKHIGILHMLPPELIDKIATLAG